MPVESSPEAPLPLRTVSRLIADWVGKLGSVWAEAQVTGLTKRPGTNVAFVTLRDPAADLSMSATMARSALEALDPPLSDGARVIVHVRPQYFFQRGQLQLQILEVRPVGIGALLAQLERLRGILQAEGLFDPTRKRPLPFLPRAIGVVTGRESAARRDVEENAQRRWPAVRLVVREVAVQGPYAVAEVTDAIGRFDRDPEIDVIVVARGGGSVEDLLPFSDESLCRAVASCVTPVVSAIGHESDSPLLDFVADVRASTPTDAAKRVVPDVAEEAERVRRLRRAAWRSLAQRVAGEREWLAVSRTRASSTRLRQELDRYAGEVSALRDRSRALVGGGVDRERSGVGGLLAQVVALSPGATLERGYAVVQGASGDIVRDATSVTPGDVVGVRLARGRLVARVEETVPPAVE